MTDGDDAATFLYLIGCVVLVGGALFAHRIPMRQGVKMAAAWLLIFGVTFVGFTLKDDFVALGNRVLNESKNDGQIVTAGRELRIRKSLDGHFWVNASMNGEAVRFLVDSGATTTSISDETARRANVEASVGLPVRVETANGSIQVQRGRVKTLRVGEIVREDVAVHISEVLGPTDILGMNFLSSLSSWGVEGSWLILRP